MLCPCSFYTKHTEIRLSCYFFFVSESCYGAQRCAPTHSYVTILTKHGCPCLRLQIHDGPCLRFLVCVVPPFCLPCFPCQSFTPLFIFPTFESCKTHVRHQKSFFPASTDLPNIEKYNFFLNLAGKKSVIKKELFVFSQVSRHSMFHPILIH